MQALDLPTPRKIQEAVPANQACGEARSTQGLPAPVQGVRQGFERVNNLEGGMVAYNAAGLPVARAGR